MSTPLSQEDIASFQGAESARILLIALFGLSVYEQWLITLDDELKYFWTGPWELSRILFLVNRYLTPAISVLALVCFSLSSPSPEDLRQFCKRAIQAVFVTSMLALGVVQAMLVIRVWYLFSQSRIVSIGMLVAFAVTNIVSLFFAIADGIDLNILENLPQFNIRGCRASRPPKFWRLYLPSLILHTVLYCLTAFRALRNRRIFKRAPILKRLVRDGGFFYFVVFISVLLTTIGSFLPQYPSINIPAIFSTLIVATTSIAASRVMLSIHSLAAKLGSDSAWLLNNIELSRVPWRRGATEGEIIVDQLGRDSNADDDELYSPSTSDLSLKTSRVGRWNDETW
ncbi:hypothetical protein B0H15DRAFT_421420 [Mycena belliarum]|uniref:DUF6533 domain-containing protein n=1 Tax=Mycena belliarum TaxID=1033014 RepID=A0AAD6U3C8_9AGAR|nr:hypothetical protein B0H15DRAFT_421420 [Mycena belliae]